MGFILAVVIFWLVFVRWGKWTRYACTSGLYMRPEHWQGGGRRRVQCGRPRDVLQRSESREPTQEGALEMLKRRYVAGELSDEQYEDELDTLFRKTSIRGRA